MINSLLVYHNVLYEQNYFFEKWKHFFAKIALLPKYKGKSDSILIIKT